MPSYLRISKTKKGFIVEMNPLKEAATYSPT